MPRVKRKQVMLLAVAIIILIVITEFVPSIASSMKSTTVIEYGNLKVEDEVEGIILRDETVYVAKTSASVEYKASESDQVKVGSHVIDYKATVTSGDEEVAKYSDSITENLGGAAVATDANTALRKGVFSTYIDGYENYFTVANFEKLKKSSAMSKAGKVKDLKKSSLKENQPIYKIVNHSNWYIVCWVDGKDVGKYEEGNRVTAYFGEDEVTFTVEKIVPEGESWKMLLHSNRYYEKFAQMRKTEVKLRTLDRNGILIPNKSITTKDGEEGVYIITKTGDEEFVKIRSLGSDGEYTVVTEGSYYDAEGYQVNTVDVYDEIVKNPREEKRSDKKTDKQTDGK